LLAILFVVVLGMDGYKLNPASAAKKLYNGNGTLDLFMRKKVLFRSWKVGRQQGGGIVSDSSVFWLAGFPKGI
jgi:hypothetical protein